MFRTFRKIFLVNLFLLVTLMASAWHSDFVALAQGQTLPEAPLYPGLTWNNPETSSRNIRVNVNGDFMSLSGDEYKAIEELTSPSQNLLNYYSNAQLAKSGWTSYDVFDNAEGVHYVFINETGTYLFIEFLRCVNDPTKLCISVWRSTEINSAVTKAAIAPATSTTAATTSSFGKISPANGSTGISQSSVTLKWEAYSPTPDKYSYCIKLNQQCTTSDPDWTSTYSTSVTISNLASGSTYYWQVKAITCVTCTPKTVVYADSGSWWTFKTKLNSVTIVGNAGIGGAVLSYVDGTTKTVTADGTGAYSISVPYGWSGTITPSKLGYLFYPKSATFSNLIISQTIQNFTAKIAYTISGNAGLSGATLTYTDITTQTVISDSAGNYTVIVPINWSGNVTPSKTGYTFSPTNRTYSNITSNQTSQNYVAFISIAGNAGLSGVALTYTGGSTLTDGSGNYSFSVQVGWSGTVTPSKTGFMFSPANRIYTSLTSSQTAQNYTAAITTYTLSGNVGAAGVSLSYNDGTLKTVASQADGSYSLPVTYNWSGTVTPSHSCFTFNPTHIDYNSVLSNQIGQNYAPTFNTGAGCADVNAYVNGVLQGQFGLPSHSSTRASFTGANNGPVQLVSTYNNLSIIGAERVIYSINNTPTSFSEMMGLPDSQLSNIYWLPWYNNVGLDTQLRIGNVSNSTATVHIFIGGTEVTPISGLTLLKGASTRVSYAGSNDGPVQIVSDVKIVAAERVIYNDNQGSPTSFSEMMGLPDSQLSNIYWLPWYNNVGLDTQLRIGVP